MVPPGGPATPFASVVIPAYRADATLPRCLAACLAQEGVDHEVILVVSADCDDDLPTIPSHPRLRVERRGRRVSAAEARNLGASMARGQVLAFTDADAVPDRRWLAELVAASAGEVAVAGAVLNGTPESAAGTVEWLVEFLDLHPSRPARTAWHGATVNMAVPADLWAEHGPFPTDMGGCEDTLLAVQLRDAGRFTFSGSAQVTHLNRTGWRHVLRNQWRLGVWTARLARRTPHYKMKALVRWWPLAPVAAAGRVVSIYGRVLAWDRANARRSLALLPGVVAAMACWGAGLLVEGFRLQHRVGTRPR